jgi:hemerythrin superfamily protein
VGKDAICSQAFRRSRLRDGWRDEEGGARHILYAKAWVRSLPKYRFVEETMKATALLKKQHRKVEGMFATLEKGKGDLAAVLGQLANDLAAHMRIEQTIFYPAVRDIDPEMVGESYQEHAMAELALKRLIETTPDDPTFAPKVTALKELIEHHVEEEEHDLFPAVDKKMKEEQLDALGAQLLRAFEAASEQGYELLLPEGFATSADRDQTPTPVPPHRTKRTSGGRSRRAAP